MHCVDPASDASIGLTRTATWTDEDNDDEDDSIILGCFYDDK
jgi:hypothetical protein